MEMAELRRRVGAILAAEEAQPRNWAEVERLSDELLRELLAEPGTPEIVDHYLDDADVRSVDEAYGAQQRERVRLFVTTGEHEEGTNVPLWTCAMVLALVVGLLIWFFW